MTVEQELTGAIANSRLSLERWDAARARGDAERGRALANTLGDLDAIRLNDVFLARARLLTSSELPPNLDAGLALPAAPALASKTLRAAILRLQAEQAAAFADPAFQLGSVGMEDVCVDAAAAFAIGGTLALQRDRQLPRLRGGASALETSELEGWQLVLMALELEAGAGSGWDAVEKALAYASTEGRKALAWTALNLRLVICERRALQNECRATRGRLAQFLDHWLVTLPKTEALSARSRPDRLPALQPSAATPDAEPLEAGFLADTAIALAHERNIEVLVNLTLDAALAATRAERGLLILRGEDGTYRVGATRYIQEPEEADAAWGLSSTIVRSALERAEVVVSNDVRRDPRFADCASVAHSVTGVLCVPIHARAEIEGALYLDRRGRGRPFEGSSIAAARALGSLLAAALLNARVLGALEARAEELELARSELTRALAARTAERDDMSRQLSDIAPRRGAETLIGSSAVMKQLRHRIETVALSDAPILIAGETGSGKELVARAVHAASPRRDRQFVAINCGALSESLLAAELFGSSRGAYTGSTVARPGLFVTADGGTVLLDEVGDMPPSMQTALLRVLETSEVRAVGSHHNRKVDVRVLAASHRDLVELVREGKFRDDLRYRLEVVRLEVPPLRARLEDLPELCAVLLDDVRARYSLPHRQLSPQALNALRARSWAGNVRELRHALASAALASRGPLIEPADLPVERAASKRPEAVAPAEVEDIDGHALRADSIRRALKATAGHRGRAAKLLGMSRSSLYRYCEMYGIEIDSVVESSSALLGRKLSVR